MGSLPDAENFYERQTSPLSPALPPLWVARENSGGMAEGPLALHRGEGDQGEGGG